MEHYICINVCVYACLCVYVCVHTCMRVCIARTQMPSQTPESTHYVKAEVRVFTVCLWHINLEQIGSGTATVVPHAGMQSNCNSLFTIVSVVLWEDIKKNFVGPKA